MLREAKKLAFATGRPSHVDLFVENYDLLKQWALKFTERDQELAEDLLHDTFIQFTISKPDLNSIENLEGYLFIVMRNLHLSQMRRATRTPLRALSVVEFDTVDVSFWASDPRDRMRMRDELGAVCQYACIRKESAKAASVLILRFFHGYYPEEIAGVLLTNRSAVEKRLQKARAEAKLYVEGSEKLAFMDKAMATESKPQLTQMGDDLRVELRRQIFDSRHGECLPDAALTELYNAANPLDHSLDQRTAAHIVSCPTCIEAVNSMLGLPPLASRYPLDTLGKDPGKKGGDDGPGGGGGSGDPTMLDSFINRREAHFHHQPQELCIAVNGQLQGFQRVVAGNIDATFMLDIQERVGFVEVFSEQGLRLLMLNVEPPPTGDGRQSAHIELSSGRTIDANLNFSGAHPALQVSYNDPELSMETALEISTVPTGSLAREAETPSPTGEAPSPTPLVDSSGIPASATRWLRELSSGFKFWLQPARLTAAFSILLAGLLAIFYFTRPVEIPLTAANVLANATQSEAAIAVTAETAVYRTYRLEEYSNGKLVAKTKVDDWQRTDASARRVFDEKGKMIAGEWQNANGKQIFRQGEKLLSVPPAVVGGDPESSPPSKGGVDAASADGVVVAPTVAQFNELIQKAGLADKLRLDETVRTYVLSVPPAAGAPAGASPSGVEVAGGLTQPIDNSHLIAASLTLDRTTLQPRSETIVLQVGDERKEYRFTDIRVEQKPINDVSPAIFLPEPELQQGATKVTKPIETETTDTVETNSNATVITKSTATLETEVEVFKLLDAVNALSGEQISVTRTDGQLKVSGVVDSVQRKAEIVNALAPLRQGKGVVVEIETAEESAARKKKASTTGNISIESVTVATDQSLPVETELRAYLTKKGVAADRMEDEMRAFATSVSASSRVLRRNALALKQIAERFTPAEVDRLEPAKREEWKALVRSRARAVAGDVKQLTAQLQPAFPGMQTGGGGSGDVKDASDAAPAAQRLFGLAAACDSQVSQSFAISSGGKGAAPIRSVQFWRSLAQMASLAAELQRF